MNSKKLDQQRNINHTLEHYYSGTRNSDIFDILEEMDHYFLFTTLQTLIFEKYLPQHSKFKKKNLKSLENYRLEIAQFI